MIHYLARTNRFNLSKVGEHFINPCCFGEDIGAWMRDKLRERGIEATDPDQEDWGWWIDAVYQGRGYFVGFGGNSDEDAADPDLGEWRVMINKSRSLKEQLFGREKMSDDDPFALQIRGILEAEGWPVEEDRG